jgi:hypothetical protein
MCDESSIDVFFARSYDIREDVVPISILRLFQQIDFKLYLQLGECPYVTTGV